MKKLVIILVFFPLFLAAQKPEIKYTVGCLAFYNIENLFDTIDDPVKNDDEFLPSGSYKWSTERYNKKLDRLSEVISQLGAELTKAAPAIVGLCEIENKSVLEDLVRTPALMKYNYGIVHFEGPDARGVDVALIYQKARFTLISAKPVRLTIPGKDDFYTRDQLVVTGFLDGEKISVIVNHWPSRRGGEKRSAPLRNAAAALCRSSVDTLLAADPDAKIFIMGDFNDDPVNKSIREHLRAKGSFEEGRLTGLYNPMVQLYKQGIGTLAYRDKWNLFDMIIVSKGVFDEQDSASYRFLKAKVFNKQFLMQSDGPYAGYPFRTFVGSTYMGGYADHFPVYLFLIRRRKETNSPE